jgi:Raf kinase inhibitor-like YbhB/YbcL family protein
MDTLTLTSEAFAAGDLIPTTYSCEGENVNPPLEISNTPEGTISLVIIVEDPDIPTAVKEKMGIDIFDHWIAYNIPPSTTEIEADTPIGTQGANSSGKTGYTGPCPPKDHEPTEHRYIFSVYALDTTLDLSEGVTKPELQKEMVGHVIEIAELIGRYEKQH